MVRLDTFQISVPSDCISDWNQSNYINTRTTDSIGNVVNDTWKMKDQSIGLSHVSVYHDKVIIKGSAKLLRDNYIEGINNNTLDQFIDTISKYSGITFDGDGVNEMKVLSCDVTNQVHLNDLKSWNEIKLILHASCINPKFSIANYQRKGNKGIVITGKQASEKNRLICYPKYDEVTMSRNKDFILSLSDPQKYLSSVKNVIRNELNITSKRSLTKRLKLIDNSLQSVLNSSEAPSYNFIKNIINVDTSQLLLFTDYEDMSVDQVRNRIGMEGICKMLRYDEGLVISWLKHKEGRNWYHKWHGRDNSIGYKDIISEYIQDENKLDKRSLLLDEFLELVKVA